MTRRLTILWLAGALIIAAVPAVAHHSISAEFDTSKPITFTGVVKKIDWMNPHIYTHVEVKNPDGTTTARATVVWAARDRGRA